MKLGIYGGAFNPPHVGHIRAAAYGAEALGLSKVLLIPTNISPHKASPRNTATPAQRLRMLEIAAEGNKALQVSDIEVTRGGQSYTFETVLQLQKENPDTRLVLFMGTDMFLSFLNWKNPQIILENADIGVFYRGDRNEEAQIAKQAELLRTMGGVVHLIENPVTQISSTVLRSLLVFGSAGDYLPAGVEDYVRKEGLYGTKESYKNLSLQELEECLPAFIKPERMAHVLGCRDMALELAKRWGADPEKAQRAALLHDITKALDGTPQLTLCRGLGILLDDFSINHPKTLHAFTGSLVAERIFGEKSDVVQAIASHTTGKPGMNTLEQIIYIADMMEMTRTYPGVEKLRSLAFSDLEAAVKMGISNTIEILKARGEDIHPDGQATLEWFNERTKEKC
jgi:nicotinate-nucleotide adenylyltransferase